MEPLRNPLIRAFDVSEACGISLQTLKKMAKRAPLPGAFWIGRTLRFNRYMAATFIEQFNAAKKLSGARAAIRLTSPPPPGELP